MSTSPSSRQESQQTTATPRYWCYSCSAEVPIYMAPDPTCQRCNEQFIEEIDSENDPRTFLAGAPAATATDDNFSGNAERTGGGGIDPATGTAFFRYETGDDDDIFHFFTPMGARSEGGGEGGSAGAGDEPGNLNQQPLAAMLQNLLTSMLGSAAEGLQHQHQQQQQGPDGAGDISAGEQQDEEGIGSGAQSQQQTRRPPPVVFYSNMLDGQFRPLNMNPQRNDGGEGGEGQEARGDENRPPNNFTSLLQLLSTLAGTPIDAGLVGNPDDYVFSQTALDNIISQLMEQTSGRNAPPPAPETVIDSLPKRSLTDEEIARQTDCAVCKDEFEGAEQVVELPCAHVFHEDCIKPWLKVNGTCPVCRHSVIGGKDDPSSAGNDGSNNPSSSSQPEQPSGQPGQSSSNTTQQQAPPPSSSSTQGSNSNSGQVPDTTPTLSSLLFEGARRIYNDRPPSAAWHTTIPGPFTWGPGGRTTNNAATSSSNNNNTSSTSNSSTSNNNNSNTQQQSSADPNNTDPMDLDLD